MTQGSGQTSASETRWSLPEPALVSSATCCLSCRDREHLRGSQCCPASQGAPQGASTGTATCVHPARLGWAAEGTRGAGGGDAGAHVLWHRHPRMARSRGPTSGRCFPRRARCLQRSPVSDDSGPRLRAFEKAVGPPSPLLVTRVVTVAHHVGTHERAESVSQTCVTVEFNPGHGTHSTRAASALQFLKRGAFTVRVLLR